MEVVQQYTNDFHDVMDLFNILRPSIEPTATGHIVEQIESIKKILANGYAYEVNGSVYFNVRKFSEDRPYGELSGRKIDELMNNTRELDGQSEKRDPLDFALWKAANSSHLMQWPSPWGQGFPGWHLECSVMSTKYLGEKFDIHGGGMDLKFPHHECEIAQNIGATGCDCPVNYWMHGNMLTVNGRKMAKSEGNGFTPEELVTGNHKLLDKGYSPMTVRFFMLMGHYASTLDFSNEALQAAEKGLSKLEKAMETLSKLNPSAGEGTFDVESFENRCRAAMNDDFNTPILIATLFEGVKAINGAAAGLVALRAEDITSLQKTFQSFLREVLGIQSEKGSQEKQSNNSESEALLDLIVTMRTKAKANKDWATADKIRDVLSAYGITIQDSKDGSSWTRN